MAPELDSLEIDATPFAITYKTNFQDTIQELRKHIDPVNFKESLGYLGVGNNGPAYKFEKEGQEYVVQFLYDSSYIDFKIRPLLLGRDIPNTARLVAYSLEDSAIITELLPGKSVDELPPDPNFVYPKEHIVHLIETVKKINAQGLIIDPSKLGNFLYDHTNGFSILDLNVRSNDFIYNTEFQQVMYLSGVVTARKFPEKDIDYNAKDWVEKLIPYQTQEYLIKLPALLNFVEILEEYYPDLLEEWKKHKPVPILSVEDVPNDPMLNKYVEIFKDKNLL